jgi:hypothetical protein
VRGVRSSSDRRVHHRTRHRIRIRIRIRLRGRRRRVDVIPWSAATVSVAPFTSSRRTRRWRSAHVSLRRALRRRRPTSVPHAWWSRQCASIGTWAHGRVCCGSPSSWEHAPNTHATSRVCTRSPHAATWPPRSSGTRVRWLTTNGRSSCSNRRDCFRLRRPSASIAWPVNTLRGGIGWAGVVLLKVMLRAKLTLRVRLTLRRGSQR